LAAGCHAGSHIFLTQGAYFMRSAFVLVCGKGDFNKKLRLNFKKNLIPRAVIPQYAYHNSKRVDFLGDC